MTEKAKAPASAATLAEATEPGDFEQLFLPGFEYTTEIHNGQGILALLSRQKAGAIKLSTLCRLSGQDSRTVRLQIQKERLASQLVVSDNASGYWITEREDEARQCIASLRHRAGEILSTAAALEAAADAAFR